MTSVELHITNPSNRTIDSRNWFFFFVHETFFRFGLVIFFIIERLQEKERSTFDGIFEQDLNFFDCGRISRFGKLEFTFDSLEMLLKNETSKFVICSDTPLTTFPTMVTSSKVSYSMCM